MHMIADKKRWADAALDTPFFEGASTKDEAMHTPGCALKSKEREDNGRGFPKYYGKLVVFDQAGDKVLVRSHGGDSNGYVVWEGTVRSYFEMWDCD